MILLRRSLLACLLSALPLCPQAQSWAWDDGSTPYVQSPMDVVDRMLRLAEPMPGEFLLDLGSGDGRIVVEAARRFGTRGLGVDLEPRLVRLAQDNARRAGVEALAKFEVRDLFDTDFGGADIVTAYLLPEVNMKLRPRLLAMKPGTRIVTHDYDMGDWPYDEMVEIPVAEKLVGPLGRSRAYLFVVPADARGTWRSHVPEHGGAWEFRIRQKFQVLEVTARAGAYEQSVRGMRLRGEEISLVVTGIVAGKPWTEAFHGRVTGERIEGEIAISDGDETRTVPWTAIRAK